MFNHASIVRTLLDNGANPLLNNWEGMTPVDLAKEAQNKDILDILMKSLAPKLIENEECNEWKLYKSLKSTAELECLEEEIKHTAILPHLSTTKEKYTNASHRPHRYHSTTLS
jgi:ankyrin repeat protein